MVAMAVVKEHMMKLYLDVDGVINAQTPPWNNVETRRVGEYRVRWSPDMLRALGSLGLKLNWLTSWGSAAPENLAHYIGYGLDAPVAVPVPFKQGWWTTMEWKYPGLKELEHADARFVWIDDELNPNTWRGELAAEAVGHYQNALLIAPDPRLGITPAHIEQIKKYRWIE